MAAKQLAYSDEARQKLLAGVTKLARAVRATLGPRGRNAVLGAIFFCLPGYAGAPHCLT